MNYIRFMNIKYVGSGLFLLCIILWSCNNEPPKLSDKVETLTVSYVNQKCDCPNFIESKYYYSNNPDDIAAIKDKCIYLEAANEVVEIPEKHLYDYNFVVRGQYYEAAALPAGYKAKTDETPTKGKVFMYESYELVRK